MNRFTVPINEKFVALRFRDDLSNGCSSEIRGYLTNQGVVYKDPDRAKTIITKKHTVQSVIALLPGVDWRNMTFGAESWSRLIEDRLIDDLIFLCRYIPAASANPEFDLKICLFI